jgi:hypothetical protein
MGRDLNTHRQIKRRKLLASERFLLASLSPALLSPQRAHHEEQLRLPHRRASASPEPINREDQCEEIGERERRGKV